MRQRPTQPRGPSGGRSRARWSTLDWAASVTLSAFWHLLVLAVLTLAVHPFQLPDQDRAIDLRLLPPLIPPPTPTVEVQLRPRPPPETPPPEPQAPPQPAPQTPPPEAARPSQVLQEKPVEVERRSVQAPRLQTQQAAPAIPEAPPEPVPVTRQAPALRPPVEVPRGPVPAPPRALDATRAAPQLPQAAAPEAEPAAPPAQVQALTNESVVQAPVEIRPRERAPVAPPLTTQPGGPQIPPPAAGGAPTASGAAAAGAGGQGGRPSVSDFNGVRGLNGGFGAKGGLRTTLGCENPDAYKLTPEDRAACLERFGQRARTAPDLGLPIPARKQAEYDHYEACQAYKRAPIPNVYDKSEGTSVSGLGANPTLKECGPGER